MLIHKPLSFTPYFKRVIWGGSKICEYKGISLPYSDIGESWEISVLPHQESVVEKGEYKGWPLSRLINEFGEEILGKKITRKYGREFPLLIKFIDANDKLSVQVHPNDEIAGQRHGTLGKSEMWYIIDAAPDAEICVGLNQKISPEEFTRRVHDGSFTDVLAHTDSKPGDVFFIPPGRVHAIGAGNLLVEIQQSSDITYRIFDYNRRDSEGRERELHIEQARDAIDYSVKHNYKNSPLSEETEEAELVASQYFTTRYYHIRSERELPVDPDSFTVVVCIDGTVTITCRDGSETIKAGHTLLIPAVATPVKVSGKGKILTTQA
ncbi:MAG: class I mannose-6-phosphate isomerase [Muribaculaceae bacterium]|nr:class I mannose-6-phosphate isomerase [Muribaculaceae bacterium]